MRSLVQYVSVLEKRLEQCRKEHGGIDTEYLRMRPESPTEDEHLVMSDAEEDSEEQMGTFSVNQTTISRDGLADKKGVYSARATFSTSMEIQHCGSSQRNSHQGFLAIFLVFQRSQKIHPNLTSSSWRVLTWPTAIQTSTGHDISHKKSISIGLSTTSTSDA